MYLIAHGDRFECARADKGPDFVNLYDEVGTCIASFRGISDFANYTLESGEWSAPPKSEVEILREAVEALIAARLEV